MESMPPADVDQTCDDLVRSQRPSAVAADGRECAAGDGPTRHRAGNRASAAQCGRIFALIFSRFAIPGVANGQRSARSAVPAWLTIRAWLSSGRGLHRIYYGIAEDDALGIERLSTGFVASAPTNCLPSISTTNRVHLPTLLTAGHMLRQDGSHDRSTVAML